MTLKHGTEVTSTESPYKLPSTTCASNRSRYNLCIPLLILQRLCQLIRPPLDSHHVSQSCLSPPGAETPVEHNDLNRHVVSRPCNSPTMPWQRRIVSLRSVTDAGVNLKPLATIGLCESRCGGKAYSTSMLGSACPLSSRHSPHPPRNHPRTLQRLHPTRIHLHVIHHTLMRDRRL